jgi:cobalamin biosynthesis protein CobT
MSLHHQIPTKGDIMINPKTSRPIRVGHKAWRSLVQEGLIPAHYTDPKIVKSKSEPLPAGLQSVKGRGQYKGQMVLKRKAPDVQAIVSATSKIAAKKMRKEGTEEDEADLEAELTRMIHEEMQVKVKKANAKPQWGVKAKAKEEEEEDSDWEPDEEEEEEEEESEDIEEDEEEEEEEEEEEA